MTCMGEDILVSKTLLFLHSHSDHNNAIAPTRICILSLLSIPCNQLPKILVTELGGDKLEATWMADHIERANWHSKNKCLIVSSWWQKQHFVLPCQFRLTRLSFVKITPRRRYQAKNHSASRAEASTKKIVHIKDLSGNQLAVNLWGQAANDFDSAGVMELGKTEPIIVIFVGTLVKTYDGHRGVSGSAACRWYINENLPDTNSFRRGLQGQVPVIEHLHLRGQTPAEVAAQVNLEEKTVKELLSLDLFDHRDMRFYCTATLARLSPGQSWWFPSCTTCHKSAIQNAAAYKCSDPKCIGTDALPRYKICFIAADGEAEAEFVFFDRVGRDLLGMPLITLLRHGHPPGIQLEEIVRFARQDDSTPKELDAIVSRKFRFVVSISNKCYLSDNDDLTFQVHRVDAPLDKQTQTSVFYRASSSSSTFGPGSSSSELALADDQHTGTLAESTSPDLLAHDALSPEDRAAIPLQTTPPSVTKTNTSSTTSTALAANPIRRNLFPPKGIDSVQVGEKASVSAKEKPPVPDKDSGSKRPALPEAEGDFTTPGKKKKK